MMAFFTANELVWRFGWMLLHSLWQIALIGLVLWLVLLLTRKRSANLRYWIVCCGLAFCYLPMVYTFTQVAADTEVTSARMIFSPSVVQPGEMILVEADDSMSSAPGALRDGYYYISDNDPAVSAEPGVFSFSIIEEHEEASLLEQFKAFIGPWISWLVGFWLAGVCLFAVWNAGGWLLVQRLRRQGTSLTSDVVKQRATILLERMRIGRAVMFLESMVADVPIVIGWLKPVVLLPAGLITRLTLEQLEAVIAHELAHIRRHDYLVNLLQTLTESLLFYHPVVWWLSRRIRVEREFCCDDEAIAVSGDRSSYVRTLAAVESYRAVPAHAVSFTGRDDASTLVRMHRLMGRVPSGSQGRLAGPATVALVFCLGLTVGFSQQQESVRKTNPAGEQRRAESEAPTVTPAPHSDPSANEADVAFSRPYALDLIYYDESGKPNLKFTLRNNLKETEVDGVQDVETADFLQDVDRLFLRADNWLHRSDFFRHAREIDQGVSVSPERTSQAYLLRVRLGNRVWEEDLGFHLGTLLRLESLQNELTGVELNVPRDPDKPFGLERMLSRLSGYKKIWLEGQLVSDLKLTVNADRNRFPSGTPIPVKLELTNSGKQVQQYGHHIVSIAPRTVHIFDEYGRRVPYVGGTSQLREEPKTLEPGETELIEKFDLAQFYYLRRPGNYLMYAVYGDGIRSNNFRFEVTPSAAPQPDIVGALLPLLREKWILVANPNFEGKIHPGRNFSKVEGFPVRFQYSSTGSIADLSHVWLYFTKQQAEPLEAPIEEFFLPETRYYGQIGEYHLYAHVDEKSQQRWRTVLRQVREAMGQFQINLIQSR